MSRIINHFQKQTSIAPLAMFRIIFGLMVFYSTLRFLLKGWVHDLYIEPQYFFTYYGLDWIQPLSSLGMYIVFILMLLASIGIILGFFYKASATLFFVLFTYVELIDKTNYLNHYYFVSLVSFLLIIVPAGRYFSIDVNLRKKPEVTTVPIWCIAIFKFQLGIVYFFAGIAKLNYNWLFEAQPLTNWLKHQTDLPFIGGLMKYQITAYAFAWGGALYDLTIPFLLLSSKWRPFAYFLVIIFHLLTAIMFPIGVFPFVMIASTLLFFSGSFHEKCLGYLNQLFRGRSVKSPTIAFTYKNSVLRYFLVVYILAQVLIPFRYLLYPGNLFWTEQGFRFSWRVMLIEKAGYAEFNILDDQHKGTLVVNNADHLTPQQEKMMATQPDMILQYAHYLKTIYQTKILKEGNQTYTFKNPVVRVNAQVSLFNSGSKVFIDPTTNLADISRGWRHKNWILPYE